MAVISISVALLTPKVHSGGRSCKTCDGDVGQWLGNIVRAQDFCCEAVLPEVELYVLGGVRDEREAIIKIETTCGTAELVKRNEQVERISPRSNSGIARLLEWQNGA